MPYSIIQKTVPFLSTSNTSTSEAMQTPGINYSTTDTLVRSHNFVPYCSPTATHVLLLDICKPMDVIGSAVSQSSVCAAFEAKMWALSILHVQLTKRMPKDGLIIFLLQYFYFL